MTNDESDSSTCPRCDGPAKLYAEDKGAKSRASEDRSITVCSNCGTDEALRAFRRERLALPDEWPVKELLTWPRVPRSA
ncbi:hypothetical protein AB0O47_40020 [Streptomyces noursei]|uniref:hypothetical protein n=1 Tax=Streptomyces noursei TaxID=1971 RepID=UPI00344FF1E5